MQNENKISSIELSRNVPQLRFSEFQKSWNNFKFGNDISLIHGDGDWILSQDISDNGDIKIVQLGSIGYGNLINKNLKTISKASFENIKGTLLEKGDILINRMVSDNIYACIFNLKGPCVTSVDVCWIRESENFDNQFIVNLLLTYKHQKKLQRLSSGSGRVRISKSNLFNKFNFLIPSVTEQQKIAAFLTAIDSRLQSLENKKSLLEEYKKGLMQQIFKQELRFKDEDGKGFPDWEKRKISDLVRLTLRKVPKPQENYLSIGIRSHCKGTFQKPDTDPSKNSMTELFVVRKNDLIVNITFAWEGAIAIVQNEDDGGFVSHRFPTYECREGVILPDFLQYVILLRRFRQNLDLISPGGAGRNRVMSKNDFLKLKWSIPCIGEQTKIANFLSAIDKKIALVSEQIEKTKTYKKGLLQQMFV